MHVLHLGGAPLLPAHPESGTLSYKPSPWVRNLALAQQVHSKNRIDMATVIHKSKRDVVVDADGLPIRCLRTYHPYRQATLYAIDIHRLIQLIRRLDPDIVHAHGTEDAYALAAQASGKPYVITVQGLMFMILPTLGSQKITDMRRFIRLGEHLALRRAHTVIAKSQYVFDGVHARYPHVSLHLIPNTYDPTIEQIGVSKQQQHSLAFVGAISERKGVHTITEAMRHLAARYPDTELHLVGGNPTHPTPYESEQIALLRGLLGDRLHNHGRVPAQQVWKIVAGCRALLAPSIEEMFGNQLIEALLLGTHAVVTEDTALAENVRRFGNGTVIPQNAPAALARAIATVFESRISSEVVENTRQRIRAYMGPACVSQAHFHLYEDILNTPHAQTE